MSQQTKSPMTVSKRAAKVVKRATRDMKLYEWFLIVGAAVALVGVVVYPVEIAALAAAELSPDKRIFGAIRGLNIALGFYILISIRGTYPLSRLAVFFIVLGLCGNVARNALPTGSPLTVSFLLANLGVFLWFLGLSIRPTLLERYNKLQADYAALKRAYDDCQSK